MVQRKDQSRFSPSLGQEMLSVTGIIAAVFLLICLTSFFFPQSRSLSLSPGPANWCGPVGDFLARMLISFLGISAFLLSFLLIFFSIQLFSPQIVIKRLPLICLGCTGILIASSSLISFLDGPAPGPDNALLLGGYLGNIILQFSGSYFGKPGSFLLFLSIMVFSLMLAMRFSPYCFGLKVGWVFGRLREKYKDRANNAKAVPENDADELNGRQQQAHRSLGSVPDAVSVPSVHEPVRLIPRDDEDFHPLPVTEAEYRLPGLGLLDKPDKPEFAVDREYYYAVSTQLEENLSNFGVAGKVVGISPGPVITTYEFSPAPGIKINKIVALADDLALGLKAASVRIVGSIPGKAALGIEIPNPERQIVYIRDILGCDDFQKSSSKLTLGLGMDVVGNPVIADLTRMPHVLIAGATGAGKSVTINAIICSILMKATPEEVRLLMVDPKRIELSGYEDIPHLLHPVVVDPKMASRALQWAVREMERRYELMEQEKVKSFASYNKQAGEKLPLIVIIIDELADLMMVSSREVEESIARLAQMARAAGMHLVLATQRPSVDVLTGLIKANFPTRISFKVSSKIDSRTILDSSGAEHLLGAGDMLFLPPGTAKLQRIHGAYISEQETGKIVDFLKEQGTADYDESVLRIVEEPEETAGEQDEEYDEKYDEAVALVCETGQASISMLQRRFRVGYNRAARMIEMMEKEGIVGPADGSKPREILARGNYS